MIGRKILHYQIIEELGAGGMGKIYKAEDTKLSRMVAIKFLPHNVAISSEERARFKQEAMAAARLNHPNIATVYDLEEKDNEIFIVMEYIDGQNLRKMLGNVPGILNASVLQLGMLLHCAIEIAEGLKVAHENGIVHRDIKPENIMINSKGQVKITDFGLAKMTGSELLTKTGSTLGTLAYMSPEQLSGKSVDLRTDIWSLGVVLYEMILGERPFSGQYEQSIIYSILNEDPQPIKNKYPDIPQKLEQIIYRTLSKNPDDRYSNCEQLLGDLRSCIEPVRQEYSLQMQSAVAEVSSHDQTPVSVKQNNFGSLNNIIRQIKSSWKISGTVLLLAFLTLYYFMQKSHPGDIQTKKIAVLPFSNLSSSPDDEFFSDGIMDDILTQLVKIGELRVISRTTMMRYKNSTKTLREISKELDAEVVLEGSVRKDANQLRIVVQLIDANTDEHLWAETYDEEPKQIFVIQSEIAQKIASALHAKLSSAERDRLLAPTTSNFEAYNLILKGSYYFARGGREDVEQAIKQFQEALSLDENNARAWAQLATAYARQADLGALSTDEGYSKARQAAEKALELDDHLALGHTIMGWIKRSYDWDWVGAEAECRKALELAPGDVTVIRNMANLDKSLGRFEEAITLMRRASELDPKKVPIFTSLGLLSMYANHLDEAAEAYQTALELNPEYTPAHTFLGLIYLLQGNSEKAIKEIQLEVDEGWRLYGLAQAYNGAERKVEADSALTSLIEIYGDDSAYQVAQAYAYRGEIDSTFEWLEKAYDSRDGGLSEFKGDPFMKQVEKDRRYREFLKKMRLPI